MKNIIKISILISILYGYSASAKKNILKQDQPIKYNITIKFTAKDSLSKNLKRLVTVTVYQFYSTSGIRMSSTRHSFSDISVDPTKKIDIPSEIAYVEIDYTIDGKPYGNKGASWKDFRVKAGTNLDVELLNDAVFFKGENSKEFNLQAQLHSLGRPIHSKINYDDPNYLETKIKNYRLVGDGQIRYLENNKSQIDNTLYEYLKMQINAKVNFSYVALIFNSMASDVELGKKAITFYNDFLKNLKIVYKDSDHEASYLIDFLFLKEKLDFEQEYGKVANDRLGAPKLLDKFMSKYGGYVRDRLMMVAILNLSKRYLDADNYLSERNYPIQVASPYSKMLNNMKENFSSESVAYNFSLPDTSGKNIRLSDLKGKTVILDFWFTGCEGCLVLNKAMQPVYEKFSQDKSVVFVTICVDRTKETWKQSVREGRYTHKGSIDLLASVRDKLLTTYNITTFPKMMLINPDGKLVTKKLLYPSNEKNINEIINLINLQNIE